MQSEGENGQPRIIEKILEAHEEARDLSCKPCMKGLEFALAITEDALQLKADESTGVQT